MKNDLHLITCLMFQKLYYVTRQTTNWSFVSITLWFGMMSLSQITLKSQRSMARLSILLCRQPISYIRMEDDEDYFVLIKLTVHWEGGFGRFELPLRHLLLWLFRQGYKIATIHDMEGTMDGVEIGVQVSDEFLEDTGLWRLVAMIPQGEE